MRGCRPYSIEEFKKVVSSFKGRYALRDAALFVLGSKTGYRISEIRSLRVSDLYQNGKLVDRVTVRKSAMKGKGKSRTIVLHPAAKTGISAWIKEMKYLGWHSSDSFLFRSQTGFNQPITRSRVAKILKANFRSNDMHGKLSTHSMRKHFADRLFLSLDRDLFRLSSAMGHASISSTVQYLSFRQEEIDEAILAL